MTAPTPTPDRDRALSSYSRRATWYDRSVSWLTLYRRLAVRRLALSPGQSVVDAGCGTGLSFELLESAVGAGGRIFGVEQSHEMLEIARARVEQHGWRNVTLVEAPVEDASLPGGLDAAFFCLTHDVVRTPAAVRNIVAALRPGGRVVSIGPHEWHPLFGPLNAVMHQAIAGSVSTYEGMRRPWSHLEAAVPDLKVRLVFGGWLYVASGQVR